MGTLIFEINGQIPVNETDELFAELVKSDSEPDMSDEILSKWIERIISDPEPLQKDLANMMLMGRFIYVLFDKDTKRESGWCYDPDREPHWYRMGEYGQWSQLPGIKWAANFIRTRSRRRN